MRIREGVGTRSTQIGRTFAIGARTPPPKSHAWKVSLQDNGVVIARGFINGYEPFIGSRLIGGYDLNGNEDLEGQPVLRLPSARDSRPIGIGQINPDGAAGEKNAGPRSFWVAVELKLDAKGVFLPGSYGPETLRVLLLPKGYVEEDEAIGICVLAEIRGDEIRQVRFFDQQHFTSREEGRPLRHYFVMAA